MAHPQTNLSPSQNHGGIDRKNQMRTVDMKVLVLGLCRTGTSSIRDALHMLDYDYVYPMRSIRDSRQDEEWWIKAFEAKFEGKGKEFTRSDWDRLLGHCEAVTDYPAAAFASDLMDAYPEAKLVLSVRDSPEAWKKSVLDTFWPHRYKTAEPTTWIGRCGKRLKDFIHPRPLTLQLIRLVRQQFLTDAFPEFGEQKYILHNDEVRAHARLHNRELLEFNAKEGWKPLCDFLGLQIPVDVDGQALPFPHMNDTETMKKRIFERHEAMNRQFWMVWVQKFASMLAIGAAVITAFLRKDILFEMVKNEAPRSLDL